MPICVENGFALDDIDSMDSLTIDLAGLLLVVLAHAGVLALRLGVTLYRA